MNLLQKLATGATMLFALGGSAQADEGVDAGLSARAGVEVSGNNDSYTINSTFGVAPRGSYDWRVPTKGQFFENFRIRNSTTHSNDGDSSYTAIGGRHTFDLGDEKLSVLLEGATGDKEGIGGEIELKLSDGYRIRATAEHASLPEDATRLGTALGANFGGNFFGEFAVDHVEGANERFTQYAAQGVFDINKTHAIGLGGAFVDNNEGANSYSLATWFIRYGEDVGVRARVKYDATPDNDFEKVFGEVIIAQNPTTGKPGAEFVTDSSRTRDGLYNVSVVPTGVSQVELVDVNDRADEGLAFRLANTYVNNNGMTSGNVVGQLGYTFDNALGGDEFGFRAGAGHNYSEGAEDTTNGLFGITWRNSNLTLEAGANIPIDGDLGDTNYSFQGVLKF